VYFTLDAPFVRIIGLFSNALEDPGVISSEGGKWPTVPDIQLEYLAAQLKRIKKENYTGAVIVATHHPPFSYSPPPKAPGAGGNHSSSTDMLREIDTVCKAQGVYPHAFLSGHAHNYQRFLRRLRFGAKDIGVPFIVCGDSGHNVNPLVRGRKGQMAQQPTFGADVSYLDVRPAVQAKGLHLKHYDGINVGYLRVAVDKDFLRIGFHQVGTGSIAQARGELGTIHLARTTVARQRVHRRSTH